MTPLPPGLSVLTPDQYGTTPWKNGGGTTTDIDGLSRGAGWDETVWRFGTTTIATPGPFSDLSGYDRILLPLGPGLMLHGLDGSVLDARAPLVPVQFAGETALHSTLDQAPVPVANLILGCGEALGSLAAPAVSEWIIPARGEVVLLHAWRESRVELFGQTLTLPEGHTLRAELPCRQLLAYPGVLVARVRLTGLPYRLNVGAAIFHTDGRVLVARRADRPADDPHAWQMPQGGLDAGEAPEDAVKREVAEELGTDRIALLAARPGWLCYDFPPDAPLQRTRAHRGQMQKWFALRFTGTDADIRLDAHGPPEFDAWRWDHLASLASSAVPFRRPIYAALAQDFARFVRAG